MYVKSALYLEGLNPDATKSKFFVGDTITVSMRKYSIPGGVEKITGKLESIISSTREIRLDTSETMKSHYTMIPFGLIADIEAIDVDPTEPTDEAVFDNRTKDMVNVVIPALLRQVVNQIPNCICKAEAPNKDETTVNDNTVVEVPVTEEEPSTEPEESTPVEETPSEEVVAPEPAPANNANVEIIENGDGTTTTRFRIGS